jgi:hypothetical protein
VAGSDEIAVQWMVSASAGRIKDSAPIKRTIRETYDFMESLDSDSGKTRLRLLSYTQNTEKKWCATSQIAFRSSETSRFCPEVARACCDGMIFRHGTSLAVPALICAPSARLFPTRRNL